MNNKGFTLIELIATIALLAVISLISFVAIGGIIDEGKVKDCKTLVNNIKSATNEYVSDNRYNKNFVNNVNDNIVSIDVNDLIVGNYLKGEIINPFTKEKMKNEDIGINITLNSNYTVKSVEIIGIECS